MVKFGTGSMPVPNLGLVSTEDSMSSVETCMAVNAPSACGGVLYVHITPSFVEKSSIQAHGVLHAVALADTSLR